MDLWPVDIRRFARWYDNERILHDRAKEALGLHYAMPWPNREFETMRPLRRSPVYHLLQERGASFGSKLGWERANWFAPKGASPRVEYSFGRQNWFAASAAEHNAAREAVALFDMTSFSKYLVKGREAEAALQYLCANDVAVAPGRTVYTGMLNERGGYESDLTVTRLAHDEFLVVTGSGQATRDYDLITRHLPADRHVAIVDVTSMYAVFAVMGPQSRELLQKASRAPLGNDAFAFGASRKIDLGYATVRATRLTYVGELGWELYVPVEFAVSVYETLLEAGASCGLVNAGYYAIDSLRIEKAYRAWGRELSPDYTPFEAGLAFAVKLDKDIPFRGRDALRKQRAQGVTRRLAAFTLDDPEAILWGGELIVRNGSPAGHVTSAAFGHTLGRAVALGYVNNPDGLADAAFIRAGQYRIDLAGELYDATVHLRAPYDPDGKRIKS
jgi:4-methylaminobutanoate oxidase (formaldehyde-forming)